MNKRTVVSILGVFLVVFVVFNLLLYKQRPQSPPLRGILEGELNKLVPGYVLFNPAKEMKVGIKERVEVRITKTIADNFFKELKGRGVPQVEEIRIGTFMKVRLTGDNFDITELSHEEQLVESKEFTQWEWDVIPLKSGMQLLVLAVAVRIKIPNYGEGKKDYPVLERQIKVRVNIGYTVGQFWNKYWQWIIGTLVGLPVTIWSIVKIVAYFHGKKATT